MTQQIAFDEQQAAAARKALPIEARRQAARVMYGESVAAGIPMTARELGEAFGRSERWGRDRMTEVRADLADSAETASRPEETDDAASGSSEPISEVETDRSEPEQVDADAVAEGPVPADPVAADDDAGRPDGVRSWPVLLLALPAFVAIWSGWVGLGKLTGFGPVQPFPGISDWSFDSSITLPIGMETYAAYALRAWLSPYAPYRARRFAKWSAVAALGLGAAGQVAYHLMTTAHRAHAPWLITLLVACLPVAVLGMGAALAHLLRDGRSEVR